MIYALYIEQKITIFALYTKHKYKNQINNLTMEDMDDAIEPSFYDENLDHINERSRGTYY